MRKKHKPKPKLLPAVAVDYWKHNDEVPTIWDDMSYMAEAKEDGGSWWPDYCPIPISVAYSVLLTRLSREFAIGLCAELTAAWAWDKERVVYRFDPTLASELISQAEDVSDTDSLPVELLSRLPHRCFFIETDKLKSDGFFVWIEYDVNRRAPELRIQSLHMDGSNFSTAPLVLHIVGGTIKDCIRDTNEEAQRHLKLPFMLPQSVTGTQWILKPLQLVLYLLADNTETSPATDGAVLVGKNTGRRLRGCNKAHIRRAHWHHYWVGSEQRGDRHLELRWMPPTPVGAGPTTPKIINMKTQINKNKKDSNDERG